MPKLPKIKSELMSSREMCHSVCSFLEHIKRLTKWFKCLRIMRKAQLPSSWKCSPPQFHHAVNEGGMSQQIVPSLLFLFCEKGQRNSDCQVIYKKTSRAKCCHQIDLENVITPNSVGNSSPAVLHFQQTVLWTCKISVQGTSIYCRDKEKP